MGPNYKEQNQLLISWNDHDLFDFNGLPASLTIITNGVIKMKH